MYYKDKTIRLNLRISPEQAAFIDRLSDTLGRSQSEIVRMIIDSAMWGNLRDEDIKTNFDYKL